MNSENNSLLRANYRYYYDNTIKENLYDYIESLMNRFKKLYSRGYEIYSSMKFDYGSDNRRIEIIIGVIRIGVPGYDK